MITFGRTSFMSTEDGQNLISEIHKAALEPFGKVPFFPEELQPNFEELKPVKVEELRGSADKWVTTEALSYYEGILEYP